jgi:hypothetical protein
MAHDLGADLDQLLPQTDQRLYYDVPRFPLREDHQAQVVGQLLTRELMHRSAARQIAPEAWGNLVTPT